LYVEELILNYSSLIDLEIEKMVISRVKKWEEGEKILISVIVCRRIELKLLILDLEKEKNDNGLG
jgi:hypothetical protein